jgi:hypothetical protein
LFKLIECAVIDRKVEGSACDQMKNNSLSTIAENWILYSEYKPLLHQSSTPFNTSLHFRLFLFVRIPNVSVNSQESALCTSTATTYSDAHFRTCFCSSRQLPKCLAFSISYPSYPLVSCLSSSYSVSSIHELGFYTSDQTSHIRPLNICMYI